MEYTDDISIEVDVEGSMKNLIIQPAEDITGLEAWRLMQLVTLINAHSVNGLQFDASKFIDKYKLERHFVLIEEE